MSAMSHASRASRMNADAALKKFVDVPMGKLKSMNWCTTYYDAQAREMMNVLEVWKQQMRQ